MYTCPMHPEIRQGDPGKCPKCGMALVPEQKVTAKVNDRGLGEITWRNYIPLVIILGSIFAVTAFFAMGDAQSGMFFWRTSVAMFMALFFTVFAIFKLLDLRGFAEGYAMYDLLAKRFFVYGYIYPFIELFFGLSMAAAFFGIVVLDGKVLLWAEFIVMAFSGLGVVLKMAKGEEVQCVCLGTVLKVPLTYVTLLEDFGMAALALILLLA